MAWTGVVAIRSRPQEGQNFDFPVISLPQREQNMRGSYRRAGASSSGVGTGVSREDVAKGGAARRRGGGAGSALATGDRDSTPRENSLNCPAASQPRHLGTSRAAILRDLPRHPLGEPVVPYHTIAFSQQKLRAALRRACRPGARVHLRVRGALPPPPRASDPGSDHAARREPGTERAAAQVARGHPALAVRARADHPRAG